MSRGNLARRDIEIFADPEENAPSSEGAFSFVLECVVLKLEVIR